MIMTLSVSKLRVDTTMPESRTRTIKPLNLSINSSRPTQDSIRLVTPPRSEVTKDGSIALSPRFLVPKVRKQASESELIRSLRKSQYVLVRSERQLEKPALLELVEAKWASLPKGWSTDRKILETAMNPPSAVAGVGRQIPKRVIDDLSRSNLGRRLIREGLSRIPPERLRRNLNSIHLEHALHSREFSVVLSPARPKEFQSFRTKLVNWTAANGPFRTKRSLA